uniref:Cadherin-7 n=1 Tax=Phallusia mammillata TaxID=59560 RepID=A0A6F9DNY4_9ASCI|nr:cadherin-7 [Phallusia mammillata]
MLRLQPFVFMACLLGLCLVFMCLQSVAGNKRDVPGLQREETLSGFARELIKGHARRKRVISHPVLSRKKRWDFTTYSVTEEQNPPQRIARMHSSFDNYTDSVIYSIEGEGAGSLFRIERLTGKLFAQHKLDRESKDSYQLMVFAKNLQGQEVEAPSNITITVQDINDHPPKFPPGQHYAVVKERSPIKTLVTTIFARDEDDPNQPYGQIGYSLVQGNASNKFAIHEMFGTVKTITSNLDREETDTYKLVIKAVDSPRADLHFSATTTLTISIADVNDNPPTFVDKPFKHTTPEDAAIGSQLMRVSTTDPDARENKLCKYSIIEGQDSNKFEIVTLDNQGVIKVKERLDYETAENKMYHIRIKATNIHLDPELSYLGPMEDEADLTIRVTDVDEPPEFTQPTFEFSVSEDAMKGFPIGSVLAKDPEGDSFTYYMTDKEGKFQIDGSSGMIFVAGQLDRETKEKYEITVTAGTPAWKSPDSVAKVIIRLADVNDHPPQPLDGDKLEYIVCENHPDDIQELKPKVKMTDVDDPNSNGAPFHFSFQTRNKDFRLVNNGDDTASLFTVRKDYSASEKYQFPIIVSDNGKPQLNATYLLTVRVCKCADGVPQCDAMLTKGGIKLEVLIFLILACLLLLVLVVVLLTVRRRRRLRSDALIKASTSSFDDEDIRENIIQYDEEGGGEEDTAAYDLSALQKDYCSSASGSQVKFRMSSPPSTKVSLLPPYDPTSNKRRPIPSEDIRDFVIDRKAAEDDDDRKLAFDSLQIYVYEGEGSDAGSLSSLCTSSDESVQDYDYLCEWGPRFKKIADIYGAGKPDYSDNSASKASADLMRDTLSRPGRFKH